MTAEAKPRPRPAAGVFQLAEKCAFVEWGFTPAETKASAGLPDSPDGAPPRGAFGPPRRRMRRFACRAVWGGARKSPAGKGGAEGGNDEKTAWF